MKSFAQILKLAARRKGTGVAEIEKLLPKVPSLKLLAAIPDDRWLSGMSRAIFQFGFNWQVVEKKWPGFEEAFHGFDLSRCARLTDEDMDALLKDTRIIRNPPKVRSVQANAVFLLELAQQHGSVGKLVADWPADRFVDLVAIFKKGGTRLGGPTSQYFLRSMGKESFILSKDVVAALMREGVVEKEPTAKKDLEKVQAAFNAWARESGRSLTHISRVLALSTGD
jgi:3-methyladenine DNA glycosylase Tag